MQRVVRPVHLIAISIACALALDAVPAPALVIEHGDDAQNLEAPVDDPGWANVAVCRNWTAVYLGEGWLLTATHVGACGIELDGARYEADWDSLIKIRNADRSETDLLLFRVAPIPDLPGLEIAGTSPPIGAPMVLVGSGLGRGKPAYGSGRSGFYWGGASRKRWGTSVVDERLHDRSVGNTDAFAARFSISQTRHEAHAAHGDSGGAGFVFLDGRWQLAGIILAVDSHPGQPPRSSIYGNRTFFADLSRYRESIRDAMARHLE